VKATSLGLAGFRVELFLIELILSLHNSVNLSTASAILSRKLETVCNWVSGVKDRFVPTS
jgi:hypothetical protein